MAMSTQNAPITYTKLAYSFFKINLVTFGGGYAIMPIIKREYVEVKHLIQEEDMMDLLVLAQSIPGAMAVNTSMLVGFHLKGFKGAVVSLIGAVLPSLLVIIMVYYFYLDFQQYPLVLSIFNGMRGAVSAIMVVISYTMIKELFKKDKAFTLSIALMSFIASYFFSIPIGFILVLAGFCGYGLYSLVRGRV
jgi:chromate transporter